MTFPLSVFIKIEKEKIRRGIREAAEKHAAEKGTNFPRFCKK